MLKENLTNFAREFQRQINEFSDSYKKYKFQEAYEIIRKLDIFKTKHVGFTFFYSESSDICACLVTNSNQIEIIKERDIYYSLCRYIFLKSLLNQAILSNNFNLKVQKEIYKLSKYPPMFKVQKGSKLILSGAGIEGTCIFAKIDKTSEVLWINGELKLKITENFYFSKNIPFIYIAKISKFTGNNANNLFLEIINLVRFSNEKKIDDIPTAWENLKSLIIKFESLLLSNPKEKEIEKFIENNFILLKIALNLENPIFQPELPKAGLRPDLIAFNFFKEEWVILDYKLSKYEKLVVGQEKRKRFSSLLEELIAQLEEYVEFFDDSENREKFQSKYNVKVGKRPYAIGLIGFIKNQEQKKEFNRKRKKRLHYGFDIFTYDEILKVIKKQFSN